MAPSARISSAGRIPLKRYGLAAGDSALECLTEREVVVLKLLVKGFKNAEIARQLGISVETVRTHISHALRKTGLKTRAGLVGWAFRR